MMHTQQEHAWIITQTLSKFSAVLQTGKQEIESRKQEAGNRKQEARSRN